MKAPLGRVGNHWARATAVMPDGGSGRLGQRTLSQAPGLADSGLAVWPWCDQLAPCS